MCGYTVPRAAWLINGEWTKALTRIPPSNRYCFAPRSGQFDPPEYLSGRGGAQRSPCERAAARQADARARARVDARASAVVAHDDEDRVVVEAEAAHVADDLLHRVVEDERHARKRAPVRIVDVVEHRELALGEVRHGRRVERRVDVLPREVREQRLRRVRTLEDLRDDVGEEEGRIHPNRVGRVVAVVVHIVEARRAHARVRRFVVVIPQLIREVAVEVVEAAVLRQVILLVVAEVPLRGESKGDESRTRDESARARHGARRARRAPCPQCASCSRRTP